MSFIGKNIKKIRSLNKLNQQEFADLFNLKRASIGAYEEGRADPKIKVVIEIANKFGISLDDFLQKELTVNDLAHFDLFKEGLTAKVKHNLKPKQKGNESNEILFYSPANLLDLGRLEEMKSSHMFSLPSSFLPKKSIAFQVYKKEANVFGVDYEDIVLAVTPLNSEKGVGVLVKEKEYLICNWIKSGSSFQVELDNNWQDLNENEILFEIEGRITKSLSAGDQDFSKIVDKLNHLEEEIKKGR